MTLPLIISYWATISAILMICFGGYVLFCNYNLNLYRLFFLICLVASLSAFSTGMMFISANKEILLFWSKISLSGCIFFNVLNLHFSIMLTQTKMKKWIVAIFYLPTLLIIYLNFTKAPIIADFIKPNILWKFIPNNNFTNYFFIFYSSLYVFFSIILFYRKFKSSRLKKERLQMSVILAICLPLWGILAVSDFILPHFEFYRLLPLGPLGRMIYIFVLWFALMRYRFLIYTPSIVADEIISNIQDMVIILTPQLKIMLVNNVSRKILFSDKECCNDCDFFDIAIKNDEFLFTINEIINGKTNNAKCRLKFKGCNESLLTDTYCSRITDKFEDFIGILLISKINKYIRQFQKLYKLSARQLEVIELSVNGATNAEISQKLEISKKTTETHFFNIYNKLGINNRIELFIILKEFSSD